MNSKTAKCILVPTFVLNIGLLYAFLLTISHLLAWVTIARHEKTIEELKEIMSKHLQQEKQPLNSQRARDDDDEYMEHKRVNSDVMKV